MNPIAVIVKTEQHRCSMPAKASPPARSRLPPTRGAASGGIHISIPEPPRRRRSRSPPRARAGTLDLGGGRFGRTHRYGHRLVQLRRASGKVRAPGSAGTAKSAMSHGSDRGALWRRKYAAAFSHRATVTPEQHRHADDHLFQQQHVRVDADKLSPRPCPPISSLVTSPAPTTTCAGAPRARSRVPPTASPWRAPTFLHWAAVQ